MVKHLECENQRRIISEKDAFFKEIFRQAPIGIAYSLEREFSENPEENVFRVNPAVEQILGWKTEDLTRLGWARITHPDDLEKDLALFKKLHHGDITSYSMEKRYFKPDGSIVWVEMAISPLFLDDPSSSNHIYFIMDITDRKRYEEQLAFMNEHDVWTGLENRLHLEKILHLDLQSPCRGKCALVSVNISDVHALSMTFGFHYSQNLIKRTAEILAIHADEKHLLFKNSEYRFVFYVKNYQDKDELVEFCHTLTSVLEPSLSIEGVGCGIGVVEMHEGNNRDVHQLLRNVHVTSEKALNLYEKGNYGLKFFDNELKTLIHREEQITRELSQIAVGNNSDRLYLQYQPLIDIKTNTVCCFEALARLQSIQLGIVSPLEFIPIAEKTKLIVPLGERIFKQALYFLRTLKDNGHPSMSISINISIIQLLQKNFIDSIFRAVEEVGIPFQSIGIEITETVFSSNFQEINRILGLLKSSGIQIAIDDFGTGYSSLARERELNVNCLKIDKMFIDKLLTMNEETTITSDIVSMSHKLGHCVIAEGVEHERQRDYLEKHGCDKLQGYLVSKPLDEDAAIEFANTYKRNAN